MFSSSHHYYYNITSSTAVLDENLLDSNFVRWPKGDIATTNANGNTYHTVGRMPCPDAFEVAIVVANADTASCTYSSGFIIAPTESDENLIEPTGSWVTITFDGTAAVTIPAGSQYNPTYMMSDFVPFTSIPATDGGWPFFMARGWMENTGGQKFTGPNLGLKSLNTHCTDKDSQNYIRSFYKGGNHVSSPSGMTLVNTSVTANSTGATNIVAYVFRCRTKKAARFMFVGDSITAGQGAQTPAANSSLNGLNMYGAGVRAVERLIADGVEIQGAIPNVINHGCPGWDTSEYLEPAKSVINLIKPAEVYYSVFSPNDGTPDATIIANQLSRADEVVATCESVGTRPVFTLMAPNNNYNATADGFVLQLWDNVASRGYDRVNLADAISDGATPRKMKAGFFQDSVHPSSVGYYEMSVVLERYMRSRHLGVDTFYDDLLTTKSIMNCLKAKNFVLNGADVQSWSSNDSVFYWEQNTAAAQPAYSTLTGNRGGGLTYAGAEFMTIDAGQENIINSLTDISTYLIAETAGSQTAYQYYYSGGLNSAELRYGLYQISSLKLRHGFRAQDGGSAATQISQNDLPVNQQFLAESHIDVPNDTMQLYVNSVRENSGAHGLSAAGSFDSSDSLMVSLGGNGTGQLSGIQFEKYIYTGLTDAQKATLRESFRRKHGTHNFPEFQAVGISNNLFWYKATIGVTADGSNRVSQWDNVSSGGGTGYNINQSTDANKPVYIADVQNGLPAIRFDGVNDYLSFGGSGLNFSNNIAGATIFIACRWEADSTGSRHLFINTLSNSDTKMVITINASNQLQIGEKAVTTDTASLRTDTNTNSGSFGVYCFYWDFTNTTVRIYENGNLNYNSTSYLTGVNTESSPATVQYIGNTSNGFKGDIAELIGYQRALTSTEITEVTTYLMEKYNIDY